MTYKEDFMKRVMEALIEDPDMSFDDIADRSNIPIDKIEDCVEDPTFIKEFHDYCVNRNMAPHIASVTKKITEQARDGDVPSIKLFRESLGLASSEVKIDLSLTNATDDELRNRLENVRQKLDFEDVPTIIPDNEAQKQTSKQPPKLTQGQEGAEETEEETSQ